VCLIPPTLRQIIAFRRTGTRHDGHHRTHLLATPDGSVHLNHSQTCTSAPDPTSRKMTPRPCRSSWVDVTGLVRRPELCEDHPLQPSQLCSSECTRRAGPSIAPAVADVSTGDRRLLVDADNVLSKRRPPLMSRQPCPRPRLVDDRRRVAGPSCDRPLSIFMAPAPRRPPRHQQKPDIGMTHQLLRALDSRLRRGGDQVLGPPEATMARLINRMFSADTRLAFGCTLNRARCRPTRSRSCC